MSNLLSPGEVVSRPLDFEVAVMNAAEYGFAFAEKAIGYKALEALQTEAENLHMIQSRMRRGKVKQSLERAYLPVGHAEIPIATTVQKALIKQVGNLAGRYSELGKWQPNEVGYQLYRDTDDSIGRHRDRKSDRILGATITVNGSADVAIYEPKTYDDDYDQARQVKRVQTKPGTVMFLRADGLLNGSRAIHEVFPPNEGSRLVLNFRMRPDILK